MFIYLLRFCIVLFLGFGTSLANAADLYGWGVVVLHGKGGSPGQMAPVTSALSAAGATVIAPPMSWSRSYRTYDQTLSEVAAHIATLKARGAGKIALVGQSLGANVALGYATNRGGLTAVVAMAPGHMPDRFARNTAESLDRARAAVAAGRGNEQSSFVDVNQGRVFQVRTSAAAYLSFFDPDGKAVFSRNSGAGGAPVLWVVGNNDEGAQAVARGGTIVNVRGGHGATVRNGASAVTDWLGAR